MKKVLVTLYIMILCASNMANLHAQDKSLAKRAKKDAEKLIKEGWSIDGEKTIEESIYNHLTVIAQQDNEELIGMVDVNAGCKEIGKARQWATLNVASSYAKKAGMQIRGFIVSELGTDEEGDYENFCERYEANLRREIKNIIKPAYSIYRIAKDGNIEYKAYFVVNENEVTQLHKSAALKAADQSNQMNDKMDRISGFLSEPNND